MSSVVNKVDNAFVFEWGTGIGADIGLNGTEFGIANTFGQTYYQGEWHDYDRVKGSATVGISDRIALGASREYTLYSNSVSYNKCVSNPFCIMNSNNSQIDNYFFFKDRKTNAVIEGNFVGLSVDFYLIVGFDLKIGFMIE